MTTTSPHTGPEPAPGLPEPGACPAGLWDLGIRAVARARTWADASAHEPVPRTAELLSRILADPDGLEFTTRFVDDVVRPADLDVAGRALQRLAAGRTGFLPPALSAAMGMGGLASRLAPSAVAAIARRTFRELVGDLVVDATDRGLGPALARLRKGGNRLNVNLLGEAVLGEQEAGRRLADVADLVTREDVDYVSVKVSAVTGPHNPWGFEEVVAHGVEVLTPLYRLARDHGTFLNLDMEDYKDLDLTLAVFTAILDQEDLAGYEAGIVLQAYLPDSLAAMQRLQEWAAARVAAGGACIKVRVVKGANLAMEAVDAQIHGWEMTTLPSKQATDTNYKRILDWAMTPERTRSIRLGVAGQNLFDIALAYEMRAERGLEDGDAVEFEMLSGMATGIQEVVRRDVGHLLLYVPVVSPAEFDVAIAYLVRRLEENAAPANFMSGVFDIATDEAVFNRERDRFLAALADVDPSAPLPAPRRGQDRLAEAEAELPEPGDSPRPFTATPDSDPALAANRRWARRIAAAVPASQRGVRAVASGAARLSTTEAVDAAVELLRDSAPAWAGLGARERAIILHRVGDVLAKRRGELIEVAASEAGKTIDQADPEVSEAIDFCHHYAEMSLSLEDPDYLVGARFAPSRLTVVASPWNFPLAIPTGGVAAALATGSAVILKPAPPAKRCAAELVEAFHEAGVPQDVLMLAPIEDGEVSQHLVTHEGADRVILTGSYDTARLFRSWKPDMHLLGETSGKNAIIVTPSADPDLAVRDTVASAFAHAGQKCSASSLLILVGSAGRSERIARQLVDATASLRVAGPEHLDAQVGPVVVPDEPKALRGLTTLGAGEHWVLRPRHLGGGLWRPGIRAGVRPGSEYHLTEYFAPVLGVMRVDTLQEAIDAVNAVDYGLTSGLQTLDAEELELWLEQVEAGNLYVNRGITGAIVRRQPFGGWKRSAIGSTTKAGGPSYLLGLGDLVAGDRAGAAQADDRAAPVVEGLYDAARHELAHEELAFLRGALAADARAWEAAYGRAVDVTGLACERNALRYRSAQVVVRAEMGTAPVDLVRVMAAGILSGAVLRLSTAEQLSPSLRGALAGAGVEVVVEAPVVWQARLADLAASGDLGVRVRLLGPREQGAQERWQEASRVTGGSPDVALYTGEVTACPHSELLPFLREQSVSVTSHRFGTPFDIAEGLL
ncbi:proline dehydrogenase family protein [Actinomyces bowdenii]|uniref:proline dehydrogenase family protein n=1 Tax=Actinomyces bowdenii TaxID=131109 RepID=UPI001ABCD61B|nr:proline dehydrogenase family protein [Actinomyces bowdenii]MBO3724000.1 proline dehydrogenase family protein [Actinomyces bowdenii]